MKKTMILAAVILELVGIGCNSQPVSHTSSIATTSPAPSQPITVAPVQPPPSRWKTSVDINSLDNKKLVTISTHDVVIRCGSKFEGYIVPTLTNLGHMLETEGGHYQEVRYKFDEGKIHRETWTIADSFDALFFPTSVLRELPKHKTLMVEYQPEYTTKETESFDLSGLDQAVAAGCPASFSATKKATAQEPTGLVYWSNVEKRWKPIRPASPPTIKASDKSGVNNKPTEIFGQLHRDERGRLVITNTD